MRSAEDLRRVSELLDQVLALAPAGRDAWRAALRDEAARDPEAHAEAAAPGARRRTSSLKVPARSAVAVESLQQRSGLNQLRLRLVDRVGEFTDGRR